MLVDGNVCKTFNTSISLHKHCCYYVTSAQFPVELLSIEDILKWKLLALWIMQSKSDIFSEICSCWQLISQKYMAFYLFIYLFIFLVLSGIKLRDVLCWGKWGCLLPLVVKVRWCRCLGSTSCAYWADNSSMLNKHWLSSAGTGVTPSRNVVGFDHRVHSAVKMIYTNGLCCSQCLP